jgi:hypothetical protein
MNASATARLIAAIAAIWAFGIASPSAGAQVSVDFPLSLGNLPSYDRVDGLSLPFGPTISVGDDDRLVATPMLTYRSHLGKIDPSISVIAQITSDSSLGLALTGARGTITNEDWIRSDLINSLVSFGLGRDSRNYFRADRGEARLTSSLHLPIDVSTVFAGVRTERAWSTGWRSGDDMGPFSVLNRRDTVNGIERPNPEINAGHITSVIAGGHAEYVGISSSGMLDVLLERAGKTPIGGAFQQLTVSGAAVIPTVLDQHLDVESHLVATSASTFTPRQRYAYLGGSGSLATIDLLSLGGDRLYFVDMLYVVPIPQVEIPLLGNPYIAGHFATGAAGIGGFGESAQNIGARIGASILTIDYVLNPRTHAHDFGAGISLRP